MKTWASSCGWRKRVDQQHWKSENGTTPWTLMEGIVIVGEFSGNPQLTSFNSIARLQCYHWRRRVLADLLQNEMKPQSISKICNQRLALWKSQDRCKHLAQLVRNVILDTDCAKKA
jgi:hypothetical protein